MLSGIIFVRIKELAAYCQENLWGAKHQCTALALQLSGDHVTRHARQEAKSIRLAKTAARHSFLLNTKDTWNVFIIFDAEGEPALFTTAHHLKGNRLSWLPLVDV